MGLKGDGDVVVEDVDSNSGFSQSFSSFLFDNDNGTVALFSLGGESETRRELGGCSDENEFVCALFIAKCCRFRVSLEWFLELNDRLLPAGLGYVGFVEEIAETG